ncbi:type 4a pilus biogenesis protein PilO [bacterium]|nr:type 4a pilus biogenesis protein PilO [bacterium]
MTRTLFSLLFLAAAGGLFFFYTRPAYDGVRSVQAQIAQYDQALNKAAELQRLKQQLLSRYNAFNPTDVDRLHKLLPDHVDNVRLVLDLDTLASQYGFALQNVVINAPGTGTAGANGAEQQVSIGPSRQTYDSLTLKFATSGTYPKFVEFITALEGSLRLVDVVNLTLDADAASAAGGEPIYRFDITLRTYWLK